MGVWADNIPNFTVAFLMGTWELQGRQGNHYFHFREEEAEAYCWDIALAPYWLCSTAAVSVTWGSEWCLDPRREDLEEVSDAPNPESHRETDRATERPADFVLGLGNSFGTLFQSTHQIWESIPESFKLYSHIPSRCKVNSWVRVQDREIWEQIPVSLISCVTLPL